MTWVNVSRSQFGPVDHVPLSCVPPRTPHVLNGSIATFQNWIELPSVWSTWSSCVGTRDSIRWQVVRLPDGGSGPPPLRCGSSHCAWVSANCPLVRMTPPSEPSKIWVGFDGLTAIACWSGWMPFGEYT